MRKNKINLLAFLAVFLVISNVVSAAPKTPGPSITPFYITETNTTNFLEHTDVTVTIPLSDLPVACEGKNRYIKYVSAVVGNGYTSLSDFNFGNAWVIFEGAGSLFLKPPVSASNTGLVIFSQEFDVIIPTESTELVAVFSAPFNDPTVYMNGRVSFSGYCSKD